MKNYPNQKILEKTAAETIKKVAVKLSEWTGQHVEMELLAADLMDLEDVKKIIASITDDALIFYIEVQNEGTRKDVSYMFVTQEESKVLIDLLNRKKIGVTKVINEIGLSALKETTNLIIGTYLNELVRLSGTHLVSSQPFYLGKKGKPDISSKFSQIAGRDGEVVVFQSVLSIIPHKIRINLLLFFNKILLDKLLK